MKTKTIVTDITHEDLVNLMSTATEGSNYLSLAFINEDDYYGTKLEDSNDCWEDKFAKVLLDGGCIEVLDYYAEDEDDFNGDKPHRWDGQCMAYTIGLPDIEKGIVRALDNGGWDAKCANGLINIDTCCDFDLIKADNLLKIIVFGEAIYG